MTMKRAKISVIGAGFTAQGTVLGCAERELGDIVLLDIPQKENFAKGVALDLLEATPVNLKDLNIYGTADYADIEGSDVVVVTAGFPRKPGMSREDLISKSGGVVSQVAENIAKYAPDAFVIVLTNPVDSMTYTMFKKTGFPKNRVLGQSGVLDTARYRTFISQALNVSVRDISALVLGGHGDEMVPLVRYTSIGGVPLQKLMPQETIDAIVERTRKGGGEIVNLMGTSAGYAPGAAIAQMAEAIIRDQHRVLPAIAYLEGEYGLNDMYLGVPAIIGGNGLEKIIEVDLTAEEAEELAKSAAGVKKTIEYVKENVL
ncbi:MAG: malate dehydrogenase [Bacillota bacterium]|nr:malate dehydrogenase [Bacillota bacterium]MDW7682892.1 malate dehydrogenase [Bacillota bacterium]